MNLIYRTYIFSNLKSHRGTILLIASTIKSQDIKDMAYGPNLAHGVGSSIP